MSEETWQVPALSCGQGPDSELQRVLVVMAHPDDPEFFCGGTLACWADQGKEITYLLATSGDKGCDDPEVATEEMLVTREAEQRLAADVIGAREPVFLRHPDGELIPDLALQRQIVRAIRLWRPDILVTTDPQRYYVGERRLNHPDHRAIGEAALAAAFPAAGNPRFFPELFQIEGLAPHTPAQVWIAVPDQPSLRFDITTTIERKIEAIRQHSSQLTDPAGQLARVRQRAMVGENSYAEFFKRIDFR